MKTLKLIALAAFALLFSQCKTTAPTAPSGPAPSLLEVHQLLDSANAKFLEFGNATNGNPQQAIILTESWLNTQPTVASANNLDSTYIYIKLKSGLTSVFYFTLRDPTTGMSITRGGPTKNIDPPLAKLGTLSTHTISNKKVLIYSPPFDEFYTAASMQKITDLFTQSGLGLTVTLLKGQECTYQTIDHLNQYGLVILDTHGLPDAFMLGSEFTIPVTMTVESDVKKSIDAQIGEGSYDRFVSGDLRVSGGEDIKEIATWYKDKGQVNFSKSVWMPSKHIASLTGMNNTIVFGNMCYSGWNVMVPFQHITIENPIASAFIAIHPISYYCYAYQNQYSNAVHDDFSHLMEDSLVRSLVINLDSTGQAYKRSDNAEFIDSKSHSRAGGDLFFKHFGADDYSYMKCRDTMVDPRDGQVYPTICIGKQIWMAKDLNYNSFGSMCYDSVNSSCNIYGRLYTWEGMMQGSASSNANPSSVQGVCPKGWHVPSNSEWEQMDATLAAGGDLKDTTLWEAPNAGATNITGFSALPGGYHLNIGFSNIGKSIMFGASTITSNYQQWWGLNYYNGSLSPTVGGQPGDNSASYCRCVKDP